MLMFMGDKRFYVKKKKLFEVRKKCPYSELFRIYPHLDYILRISSHSAQIQKMRTRITPNTDTFCAVYVTSANETWC